MIKNHYEKEKTNWITLSVSFDQLQQFLLTINETNDIYKDAEFAKQAGFLDIPLPATYPALFWQDFSIPWLEDQNSLILTTQDFHYEEPLVINELYNGRIILDTLRSRSNKQWAVHLLQIFKGQELIATMKTTLFLTKDKPNE